MSTEERWNRLKEVVKTAALEIIGFHIWSQLLANRRCYRRWKK